MLKQRYSHASSPLVPTDVAHGALLVQEASLRREASQLLTETGLREKLQRFGSLNVGGALAYRVMVARDIDLHIRTVKDAPLDIFRREIAAIFTSLENVKRLKMVDFDHWEPDIGKPKGIWFGVEFATPETWTVDLWITRDDIAKTQHRFELSDDSKRRILDLPDETRAVILSLKHYLQENYDGFRPSTLVYLAVLEHGVRTPIELDAYIDTTRHNPMLTDKSGYCIPL